MHLYLGTSPRVLYLVTSSQDESLGRPRRALIFRAGEGNSGQAVVEFLPKDEVDLSNVVRLTTRVVKGCLGLISVENGLWIVLCKLILHLLPVRYILGRCDIGDRSWKHQAIRVVY